MLAMTNATFPTAPSKHALEQGDALAPRFDAAGLIAAVATHADTGEVLMLAWMNAEALERTERRDLHERIPAIRSLNRRDMHDERAGVGASFRRENTIDRAHIKRVRAQPIHRLCGKPDQHTRAKEDCGAGDFGGVSVHGNLDRADC